MKETALEASMFTELTYPERSSVQTYCKPAHEMHETGFTPQMTIMVSGAILGISESTPDRLILKMMELIKNA